MKRLRTLAALAILALSGLAACGDIDAADPVDEEQQGPDTTAPALVSATPADGATGVRADAVVTLEFTEAMDQESVAAALIAEDLGDVTASWNAAGDVLTITPAEPLEYAVGEGNDPSLSPSKAYEVVVGKSAVDLAGNQLESDVIVEFATAKEMSTAFPPEAEISRSMTPDEITNEADARFQVGDKSSKEGVRAAFTFDIDALPTDAEILSATFETEQVVDDIINTPYSGLGDMLIDHILYDSLESADDIEATFYSDEEALAKLGILSSSPEQVELQSDVKDAVADDLAKRDERGGLSQYLIYFATITDDDTSFDTSFLDRSQTRLAITYLAP